MSQRFDLGVHHFLRREYDAAQRAFRDVVRERPTDAGAWSYYGICLAHLGQAMEAEGALSRAVALTPSNAEAWFHLGVARSLREEWGLAALAYRRTVALTPEDLVAWHRLGVSLAESGDETGASAAFERALVLSRDGSSPDGSPRSFTTPAGDDHVDETGEREGSREAKSWLELALSLLTLGEEEEAVAAYDRAYTLDPERASRSLFRPMLKLLTAVEGAGAPEPAAPMAAVPGQPEGPTLRRPEPTVERPEIG
ncbi:MAG: tetratricopeptide repeat protein [Thermoplasmata archaeon]|nr:tetratricopeptide repeat protein [Thermoplasmata archaeon]